MIFPEKLKGTAKETLGYLHKPVKWLALAAIIASGLLFVYVSHTAGFGILLIASIVYHGIVSREYYVDSIYRIRSATDLRLRLLTLQDSEYALESLAKDSIWRGEAIDPEITERLAEIRKNKEEAKIKLQHLLDELTKPLMAAFNDPTPTKPDDGKPN